MPDLAAIREELQRTTPYNPDEIEELLANVRVDSVEVARMQAQYTAHTGRPCKQKYFGRTEFRYSWFDQLRTLLFRRPSSRQVLIIPDESSLH